MFCSKFCLTNVKLPLELQICPFGPRSLFSLSQARFGVSPNSAILGKQPFASFIPMQLLVLINHPMSIKTLPRQTFYLLREFNLYLFGSACRTYPIST